MPRLRALPAFLVTALMLLAGRAPGAAADGSVWVSLDSGGNQFNAASGAYSSPPSISSDGRYIAFQTVAPDTNDGDRNGVEDVFRRDVMQPSTVIVSLSTDGQQGNDRSYSPGISADGTVVAFESLASNLVPGDGNNVSDIYLRDFNTMVTTRVSVPAGGVDANGASYRPAVSGNGAYVAFCSRASNLVPGDDNGGADAFIYERATGALTRIPVSSAGGALGGCSSVTIDDDGGVVAFAAMTGAGRGNVFAYQRATGSTTPLTDGGDDSSGLGGVAISGDGRLVVFDSLATNLTPADSNRSRDVFVRDLSASTTARVSVRSNGSQLPGDSGASGVAISRDGRFVVFGSSAPGVVPGDTNGSEDVFRHELASGQTTIVSPSALGRPADASSYAPAINADGSVVAFTSLASDIVSEDTNSQPDVFLRSGSFPDKTGDQTGPVDTGAPADNTTLVAVASGGGIPAAVIVGIGVAATVVILGGGWLLLGRRGKA